MNQEKKDITTEKQTGELKTIVGIGTSIEGKININTADLPVLAALLPVGQEFLAPEIYSYRLESAEGQFIHDLSGANWYKEVPGCSDLDIDENLITTQSDIFRVECVATLNEITMSVTVVLKRVKEKETGKYYCKVLNWKYE